MAGSAGDDLASLLQSVTEEQEKATFDVPRFFKSYNSALLNELYGMMLESEIPLKRGKKRTRPSPELTALEVSEMKRFVRENNNNIEKMKSLLSLLGQVGDEASRMLPHSDDGTEIGGCVGKVCVEDSELEANVVMCLYGKGERMRE